MQKCPLWSAEACKAVRTALSKPVPTLDVELTYGKVVVLRNTGTGATEADDDTGTKILIAPIIQGRGVPATFTTRPYSGVFHSVLIVQSIVGFVLETLCTACFLRIQFKWVS